MKVIGRSSVPFQLFWRSRVVGGPCEPCRPSAVVASSFGASIFTGSLDACTRVSGSVAASGRTRAAMARRALKRASVLPVAVCVLAAKLGQPGRVTNARFHTMPGGAFNCRVAFASCAATSRRRA
jgi:hypothetical protein